MKKTLYGLLLGVMTVFGVATVLPVAAQTDWENPDNSGMGIGGHTDQQGSTLLDSIKTAINWVLGMLATIALVICIRGGFQMVTAAGNDSKFKKGGQILKQAAVGLAIILLAWLIVSVVFWFVNTVGGAAPTGA